MINCKFHSFLLHQNFLLLYYFHYLIITVDHEVIQSFLLFLDVILNFQHFMNIFSANPAGEERDEQKEFETGPLSILMQSVKQNTQVS